MVVQAEGYVSDVPYVRVFIPHLAPAWLDHVAIFVVLRAPRKIVPSPELCESDA